MTVGVSYRVGSPDDPTNISEAQLTIELAKRSAEGLDRTDCLVLEKTNWEEREGRQEQISTTVIDAEHSPGEWKLG